MVEFGKDIENRNVFTVSIVGNEMDYMETIKAVLFYMGQAEDDTMNNQNSRYLICNMIEGMLPDTKQIIGANEMELFKEFKTTKNRK